MELEVQVVAGNQVIDRIKRAVQIVDGKHAVIYRRSVYFIHDGYIHVNLATIPKSTTTDSIFSGWKEILDNFFPATWPSMFVDCCETLRVGFSDQLPDGVVLAVARLATRGDDITARELLLDFLVEKSDSQGMMMKVRSAWVRADDLEVPSATVTAWKGEPPSLRGLEDDFTAVSNPDAHGSSESSIRDAAKELQGALGSFVPREEGASILGLEDLPDDEDWNFDSAITRQVSKPTLIDEMLLSRLAMLGSEALDILLYFSDNPGDKPMHAEHVLGYSKQIILKALSGPLEPYVRKGPAGGWECYGWVPVMLGGLEKTGGPRVGGPYKP